MWRTERLCVANVCVCGYDNDPTVCQKTILAVSADVVANLDTIRDADIFIKDRTLNPRSGADVNIVQQDRVVNLCRAPDLYSR